MRINAFVQFPDCVFVLQLQDHGVAILILDLHSAAVGNQMLSTDLRYNRSGGLLVNSKMRSMQIRSTRYLSGMSERFFCTVQVFSSLSYVFQIYSVSLAPKT